MAGFTSLPITGIQAGNKVYLRPEINEWAANNPIQLSLYIRALENFQGRSFEDVKSYFQIAGIHGLPAIPWDNDPVPIEAAESYLVDKNGNPTAGPDITKEFYCPHNTLLFPTWHRVYVLLFEQLLWEIMTEGILPQVPADQQGEWQDEANSWRLPFWDWAADPQVPDVVRTQTVSIVDFDQSLSSTSGTSRWGLSDPLTTQAIAGIQNNDFVDQALLHPDCRPFVPGAFANYAEFTTTSHGSRSDPSGWLSLEMIHNYIHDLVGGVGWNLNNPDLTPGTGKNMYTYGHMADLGTVAFEPIFWLHHCNADRQFAIYQANNGKDQWFTGYNSKKDPSATDNLYLFHTDTKFNNWNSDMVQNWTDLGYTYADLEPEKDSNDLKASPGLIQKRLTKKYGHLRRVIHKVSDQNIVGLDNDYVINITYNRFVLNGSSYIIHFFIGKEDDIPKDSADYKLSLDHVGSIHTFSANYWTRGNKNGVNCENCQKQQDNHQLSKGQIPVTLQLLQRPLSTDERWEDIQHLGTPHVVEYLAKHLH
ncbi:uncharacterized protein B0J16DRAFT_381940 [Fusarium flagelliforme]|uniref:uncharacterized protein n=1 Tax=Fusarium flagelliforme TaxID=2675880 RepID=UPI001E8D943F|nr:uncharacterized protein B0J16DRAFT_381940 [Fusarium flagelliforme]KAH7188056.1 hypothetical protein B0J16DRAFT_381940 [Fusarium flagelliforme]